VHGIDLRQPVDARPSQRGEIIPSYGGDPVVDRLPVDAAVGGCFASAAGRPASAGTLRGMYIGLGIFAVLAVICIIAGVVAMNRRREYEGDDGGMSDAEFRRIEGFDD
jgi:hypothetical protein